MKPSDNIMIDRGNPKTTTVEFEKILPLILQNASDVIFLLDDCGNFVLISDAVKQYGYTPEELTGTKFLERVHPLDREKTASLITANNSKEENKIKLEINFLTIKNSIVPMEIKFTEIRDAMNSPSAKKEDVLSDETNTVRSTGILGIARDISGRKNAEKNLCDISLYQVYPGKFIPVCANCHKIRDKAGLWEHIETYFRKMFHVEFTHSICPECMEELYPDLKLEETEK